MSGLRSWLYFLARLLGDVQAVRSGLILQRLANKAIGRSVVSRLFLRGQRRA